MSKEEQDASTESNEPVAESEFLVEQPLRQTKWYKTKCCKDKKADRKSESVFSFVTNWGCVKCEFGISLALLLICGIMAIICGSIYPTATFVHGTLTGSAGCSENCTLRGCVRLGYVNMTFTWGTEKKTAILRNPPVCGDDCCRHIIEEKVPVWGELADPNDPYSVHYLSLETPDNGGMFDAVAIMCAVLALMIIGHFACQPNRESFGFIVIWSIVVVITLITIMTSFFLHASNHEQNLEIEGFVCAMPRCYTHCSWDDACITHGFIPICFVYNDVEFQQVMDVRRMCYSSTTSCCLQQYTEQIPLWLRVEEKDSGEVSIMNYYEKPQYLDGPYYTFAWILIYVTAAEFINALMLTVAYVEIKMFPQHKRHFAGQRKNIS